MILFISEGRLGNQLFQYAFLNTIIKDNEKIIAVNMNEFLEYFEIDNTNFCHLNVNSKTLTILKKIFKPYFLGTLVKLKLIGYIKQERESLSPITSFIHKRGLLPVVLVETNYFQSEFFFDDAKIDLKFRDAIMKKANKFLSKIDSKYTKIFVHVRRGDYLFETFNGIRGIDLPKTYYTKAMKKISKGVSNPIFIFLSDDISFVEHCFSDIENKVISKNDKSIDLAIMSLCDYGIVSNSSFSWWGGYFMDKRVKVIFPKYWYGWKTNYESHPGIYPSWGSVLDFQENKDD
jgi:hypothetical protein